MNDDFLAERCGVALRPAFLRTNSMGPAAGGSLNRSVSGIAIAKRQEAVYIPDAGRTDFLMHCPATLPVRRDPP